ncbi:MAG TPA: hypothetical protein VGU27_00600 [Candidatus Eisenbacteria bacterium]|nr:hypothetical protein [Candidatus Eisenbacteria bacterium]
MIEPLWYFRRPLVVLLVLGMALAQWWPAADRSRTADAIAHSAWSYATSHGAQDVAPAGAGVVYSEAQLEGALQAEAVPEPNAHVGAAVAEAESGGRSDAVCDSCTGVREYSVGPWQENLYAHPWLSRACAVALRCAAWAAAAISGRGSNWWPWTTYRTGAWRAFA